MEETASYLLMLQKYINSKQYTLEGKIIQCVKVISQKILQLTIWKNGMKKRWF